MKIIAYFRVSTKRQGVSGLGLDAQRQAVRAFALSKGATIVAEFTETESGKRSDRAELAKAMARARAIRGTLVIAKLDRLARNVAFTSALMESGVEFLACDNPNATRLTIHILAAVAEDEARQISQRTVAALAAAKRRGTKLGTDRPGHFIDHAKGTRKGLKRAQAAAAAERAQRRADCYGHFLNDVRSWRDAGLSFATIADKLNAAGHVTTGDRRFSAMTICRMVAT